MANNNTNHTTDLRTYEAGYNNIAWRLGIAINCIILSVHLWITVRMLMFAVKTVKQRERSQMNGAAIAVSAAVATVAPIFRYLSTTTFLFLMIGTMTDYSCEVIIDVAKCTFVLSLLCLYLFFWFRQRAFYQHPSLRHTFGKFVTVLSSASIIILIIIAVTIIPVSVFPLEYEANEKGCVFKSEEKQYAFRDYMYTGAMLIVQLLVLGLFIHPLRLHYKTQKKSQAVLDEDQKKSMETVESGIATTNSQSVDSTLDTEDKPRKSSKAFRLQIRPSRSSKTTTRRISKEGTKRRESKTGRREDKLVRLVKRTLILASASVVTDLITMITVARLLPDNTPQIVNRVIYDIDLFFNVLVIAGSFENWRFFFACTKKANEDTEVSTGSTASQAKRSTRATEIKSSGNEASKDIPTDTLIEAQDTDQKNV